jgi:hypothetical protein
MRIEELKSMADAIVRNENSKKDYSISMFRLGVELVTEPTSIPIRQLGVMLGLSYVDISMAKTIAKKFDYDEERFCEFCIKDVMSWDWGKIKSRISKVSKGRSDVKKHIDGMYRVVRNYISSRQYDPESVKETMYALHNLRKKIDKFVPRYETIFDENFIKYYECCGCGSYPPPPEGYDVFAANDTTLKHVKYPLCKECQENERQPDYKRVAEMYATYSTNLEEALEDLVK